jgi:hypothetical protein
MISFHCVIPPLLLNAKLALTLDGFGFGEGFAKSAHFLTVFELPYRFLAAEFEQVLFELVDFLVELGGG